MDVWTERRSKWKKRDDDARSDWDIDYARIIHSAAFRRLQGKTQIFNIGDSDFYRNRLTHSIEVAQIATSLTSQLAFVDRDHAGVKHLPEQRLIQAIGSTHDLGHPPFGHGGEIALNYCMRANGGFEGNAQTLRLLSKLEKFSENNGTDLTRRALLGTLKYPVVFEDARGKGIDPALKRGTSTVSLLDRVSSKPPKCYMATEVDVVDWLLSPLDDGDRREFVATVPQLGKHNKPKHKSFDCSIMDVADDITFGVHDLEDAIGLKLIDQAQFRDFVAERFLEDFKRDFDDVDYNGFVSMIFGDGGQRKRAISRLIGYFVRRCRIDTKDSFQSPIVRFNVGMCDEAKCLLNRFMTLVREQVIFSAEVQHLEFKGQQLVIAVFEALNSDPEKLLPQTARDAYSQAPDKMRHICDYVAGMTDAFLLRNYERLFSPGIGSVFDKL